MPNFVEVSQTYTGPTITPVRLFIAQLMEKNDASTLMDTIILLSII